MLFPYRSRLTLTQKARICHPSSNKLFHIRLIDGTSLGLSIWSVRTLIRILRTNPPFVNLYAEFFNPVYDNLCCVFNLALVIRILIAEIKYSRVQVSDALG